MSKINEDAASAASLGQSSTEGERFAYSIAEFCKLFGLSRSAVYKLISTGRLKPSKILTKTIFTRAEVERFAASLEIA